jgi:ketosteroid isomerase-like protein
MNKWMLRALVALALWAGVAGCAKEPEEEALRDTVAALEAAVERRDADGVEELLAEDFIGEGGLDRSGAQRLAALMFLRHREVRTTLGPLEVEMQGTRASVRFTAVVTGGGPRALPDAARVYRVETGWRFEGGEWLLSSADWERGD